MGRLISAPNSARCLNFLDMLELKINKTTNIKINVLLNFRLFSAIILLLLILAKYVQRQSCRGRPPPTSPKRFGSDEAIVFAVIR